MIDDAIYCPLIGQILTKSSLVIAKWGIKFWHDMLPYQPIKGPGTQVLRRNTLIFFKQTDKKNGREFDIDKNNITAISLNPLLRDS